LSKRFIYTSQLRAFTIDNTFLVVVDCCQSAKNLSIYSLFLINNKSETSVMFTALLVHTF